MGCHQIHPFSSLHSQDSGTGNADLCGGLECYFTCMLRYMQVRGQRAPFEVPEAEPATATLVLPVEDSVNDCLSIPARTSGLGAPIQAADLLL